MIAKSTILLLFVFAFTGFLLHSYAQGYMSSYDDNGHGYLQKIGNNTTPINAPGSSTYPKECNQPQYANAKAQLASAEQSYQDLKSKYYQDWKQLDAQGKYNGTWNDYAKQYMLTSDEVGKVKQIHEQYSGFVQYCYPAPQAGGPIPPVPPVMSGGTVGVIESQIVPPTATTNVNGTTKDVLMEIEHATPIPKWVKNTAQYWATDQIGESDFVSGLQYLALQKIIHLTPSASADNTASSSSSATLPLWVKGLAGSWSEGKISNDYFVITIQSMVNQNIIKISN